MSPFITTVIERGVAAPEVDDGLAVVPGVSVLGAVIVTVPRVVLVARGADDARGGGGADTVSSVAVQAPSGPSSGQRHPPLRAHGLLRVVLTASDRRSSIAPGRPNGA
jgi:hypothetical protein